MGAFWDPWYHHDTDLSGLVVTNEFCLRPESNLSADLLKRVMEEMGAPGCVSAAGVSGVSDRFMRTLWREIVSEQNDTFDLSGKGFKTHPMWVRSPDGDWHCTTERSSEFVWNCSN